MAAQRPGRDDFMAEACRLAEESVREGWGGPFGAVIVRDGEIVARGQNRVLQTGDPTCHAEVDAIRNAAGSLGDEMLTSSTAPRAPVDPVPRRARMLLGAEIYSSGAPCPMCMSAIYWARIDAVYFANDWEDARAIGFDDAFQYEDFDRPLAERRLPITQLRPDLGRRAFDAWTNKSDRHPY